MFWILCAAGFAFRLFLIATTIGTTDVVLKIAWASLAGHYGIAHAYAHNSLLNHPPLSLGLMLAEAQVGRILHVEYTDVFRFVQVLGDAIAGFALYQMGLQSSVRMARWLTLFFVLSPAAAFVSGFHCNTDPLMNGLLALATMLMVRFPRRFVLAGVVLALACGIKILPFLLLPFFLLPLTNRERALFLGVFAAGVAIIFVPSIAIGGPSVARNIFGYSGMDRDWGFPQIAVAAARQSNPLVRQAGVLAATIFIRGARYVVLGVIGLLFLAALRARQKAGMLPAAIGTVFLAVLFVAPGFGVQYLDWPLSFLPFAMGRRAAVVMNAAFSIMLFTTYTVWSGGLPWWYADIAVQHRLDWLVTAMGVALWLGIGFAAILSARRLKAPSPPQTEFRTPIVESRPSPDTD